jgi:hypothetical protein
MKKEPRFKPGRARYVSQFSKQLIQCFSLQADSGSLAAMTVQQQLRKGLELRDGTVHTESCRNPLDSNFLIAVRLTSGH